jgi:probable HAF family extracellular repeat protein
LYICPLFYTICAHGVTFSLSLLTLNGQIVPTAGTPRLNNSGEVTTTTTDTSTGYSYATVWRNGQDGQLIAGTGGDTTVTGINDNGEVVGYGTLNVNTPQGMFQGFHVDPAGAVTYYPSNPDVNPFVQPGAINNAGVVAAEDNGLHVFGNGIDRHYDFGNNVVPSAINSSAQVTGFYGIGSGEQQTIGMFYDDGVIVHKYDAVLGRQDVRGLGINDAGVIVGRAGYSVLQNAALGYPAQFQWAFTFSNGNFTWLPAVDDYFINPWAEAINNNGWVVGWCQSAGVDFDATLWVDGASLDLNALTTNLPDDMYLVYATGVNDSGQIVALAHAADGNLYPVLLTPTSPIPEPTIWVLLPSLAALRRRR